MACRARSTIVRRPPAARAGRRAACCADRARPSRWSTRRSCAIPYLSRVDAGTVEFIRRPGRAGRLVGRSRRPVRSRVGRRGDRHAPGGVRQALPHQGPGVRVRRRASSRPASRPRVRGAAADGRRGSQKRDWSPTRRRSSARRRTPATPTTRRTPTVSRPIRPNELLLLDLWGKLEQPGAVYADITWTGFAGDPPAEIARASFAWSSRAATRRSRA